MHYCKGKQIKKVPIFKAMLMILILTMAVKLEGSTVS